MTAASPFILGIGGTVSAGGTTEQALAIALASAEHLGAQTLLFGGADLGRLPHYLSAGAMDVPEARTLVDAVRRADGVIIASPGYHGSISGLVKNAIDYVEETARDPRTYLDGVPVGLIATAYGWQATGSTLAALRSIVHALRGWPKPLGAAVNCSGGLFRDGRCAEAAISEQLALVGRQVYDFARLRSR
ncbi:NADPH-dependent FMN reductase [Sphingobium sp. CAP-1]|uniref:NADPH-dependent FMN reductase n=1 Tax=Sphingobium sp. CAP-1 TaxID=2676077 RepID=UPI0012BB4918|nr:NADPH-dependent FMN reductase [Sphingobium sp. CAP-1]QGP81283.1 FMN reductase [Sphingobium sp. CAP-1]